MAVVMWGSLAVDPCKGAAVPGLPSHWPGLSMKHLNQPTPNVCTATGNWEVHKWAFCHSNFHLSLRHTQSKLCLSPLQVKSGKTRWGISGCWNEGIPPVWIQGVVLLRHISIHSFILLNLHRDHVLPKVPLCFLFYLKLTTLSSNF